MQLLMQHKIDLRPGEIVRRNRKTSTVAYKVRYGIEGTSD